MIRKAINYCAEKAGNAIYDGLGDWLTQDIYTFSPEQKRAALRTGAAAATLALAGCASNGRLAPYDGPFPLDPVPVVSEAEDVSDGFDVVPAVYRYPVTDSSDTDLLDGSSRSLMPVSVADLSVAAVGSSTDKSDRISAFYGARTGGGVERGHPNLGLTGSHVIGDNNGATLYGILWDYGLADNEFGDYEKRKAFQAYIDWNNLGAASGSNQHTGYVFLVPWELTKRHGLNDSDFYREDSFIFSGGYASPTLFGGNNGLSVQFMVDGFDSNEDGFHTDGSDLQWDIGYLFGGDNNRCGIFLGGRDNGANGDAPFQNTSWNAFRMGGIYVYDGRDGDMFQVGGFGDLNSREDSDDGENHWGIHFLGVFDGNENAHCFGGFFDSDTDTGSLRYLWVRGSDEASSVNAARSIAQLDIGPRFYMMRGALPRTPLDSRTPDLASRLASDSFMLPSAQDASAEWNFALSTGFDVRGEGETYLSTRFMAYKNWIWGIEVGIDSNSFESVFAPDPRPSEGDATGWWSPFVGIPLGDSLLMIGYTGSFEDTPFGGGDVFYVGGEWRF